MLTPDQLVRIRADCAVADLSIAQIAADVGVARVTVQRIATDSEPRPMERERCAACGRLVAMPCLACQTPRKQYPPGDEPPAAEIVYELEPQHAARLAEVRAQRLRPSLRP